MCKVRLTSMSHKKYAIALGGGNMSVDVSRLSDELRRYVRKGQGADLAPGAVDIVMAALRSVAAMPEQPRLDHKNSMFQIELPDVRAGLLNCWQSSSTIPSPMRRSQQPSIGALSAESGCGAALKSPHSGA